MFLSAREIRAYRVVLYSSVTMHKTPSFVERHTRCTMPREVVLMMYARATETVLSAVMRVSAAGNDGVEGTRLQRRTPGSPARIWSSAAVSLAAAVFRRYYRPASLSMSYEVTDRCDTASLAGGLPYIPLIVDMKSR